MELEAAMEHLKSLSRGAKQQREIEARKGGVLIISLLFFATLYATAWFFIFRSWSKHKRCRAASSSISFAHALVGASLAMADMVSSPWTLDAPNTAFQNRIMEWSMAYFIVDLFHYFLAVPEDHLFIAHHLATLTYMISCRYYTLHGAKSVMSLIAAGEATTPLQAIWTLARLAKDEFPVAERVYTALSPTFTLLFTIVRGMLGPFLLGKLASFYLWGRADTVIPRWLAWFWVFEVSFAVVGSMIWVFRLWRGLFKLNSQRSGFWKSD
ncbi:TLC domain-containing protein At5g14285 [Selaginella moellendorffii]|nr:TLC domain-containing protein At5g14285 [Selaginella moellendorffii]|eukprot:XP_002993813.2 TLC domain-containing protein At5g14285 [Selaginella moellendorffii]